jgi:hypothetical protein
MDAQAALELLRHPAVSASADTSVNDSPSPQAIQAQASKLDALQKAEDQANQDFQARASAARQAADQLNAFNSQRGRLEQLTNQQQEIEQQIKISADQQTALQKAVDESVEPLPPADQDVTVTWQSDPRPTLVAGVDGSILLLCCGLIGWKLYRGLAAAQAAALTAPAVVGDAPTSGAAGAPRPVVA